MPSLHFASSALISDRKCLLGDHFCKYAVRCTCKSMRFSLIQDLWNAIFFRTGQVLAARSTLAETSRGLYISMLPSCIIVKHSALVMTTAMTQARVQNPCSVQQKRRKPQRVDPWSVIITMRLAVLSMTTKIIGFVF